MIALCRDKAQCYDKLTQLGATVPKTSAMSLSDAQQGLATDLIYPIVVKPSVGTGSANVRLLSSKIDLEQYIELFKTEDYANHKTKLLFQEFVDGQEYSIETFGDGQSVYSLGITRKIVSKPPFFVEHGHDFPMRIKCNNSCEIEHQLVKIIENMGLLFGPAHTEFKIRSGTPVIIEINPRLAGGMIPTLIEKATNCDLLNAWLNLTIGREPDITMPKREAASIRFLVPKNSGQIHFPDDINSQSRDIDIQTYKATGQNFILNRDFRDRLAHVISVGDTIQNSGIKADRELKELKSKLHIIESENHDAENSLQIENVDDTITSIFRGKIPKEKLVNELVHLTSIDQAHVLMLSRQNIIEESVARKILQTVDEIRQKNYLPIINLRMPRGVYLAYENYVIDQLGIETAGWIHTGRSRNDINATTFKLRIRDHLISCLSELWSLRRTLLVRSKDNIDTFMPIYSQYQPALPGTYSFYLMAIDRSLARSTEELLNLLPELQICPLGAGAGTGTNFPIDCRYTANILGFETSNQNALDAVANRDQALSFTAALSNLAVKLSRIAQDFQLFLMRELSFFDLPKSLIGGSSMMPQKKNPWLLEGIKGKTARITNSYMNAAFGMHKVPYTNSYEVGTESLETVYSAATDCSSSLRLVRVLCSNAKPNTANMERSNKLGLTNATLAANALCQNEKLSFREAYLRIQEAIEVAEANDEDPNSAIQTLLFPQLIEEHECNGLTLTQEQGGGPGRNSVKQMQIGALLEIDKLGSTLRKTVLAWSNANETRLDLVRKLITLP